MMVNFVAFFSLWLCWINLVSANENMTKVFVSNLGHDDYSCGEISTSPCATIAYAIDNRTHTSLPSEVILADGLYHGSGNRALSFRNKEITLCSLIKDPTRVVLDAENADRVIDAANQNKAVILRDVTIKGGKLVSGHGGGIYKSGSGDLVLDNVLVSFSEASANGGGLYAVECYVSIQNSIFYGNTGDFGGGIYFGTGSSWDMINTTIESCMANYGGAMFVHPLSLGLLEDIIFSKCGAIDGGALYAGGKISMVRAVASYCFVSNRGGMAYVTGQFNISWSTIHHCNCSTFGGAISVQVGAARVEYSLITHCHAGSGGALHAAGLQSRLDVQNVRLEECTCVSDGGCVYGGYMSTFIFENSELVRCVSHNHGGALYVSTSTIVVRNSTFLDSQCDRQGGCVFLSSGSSFTFSNSLLENCFSPQEGGGMYILSGGYALVSNNSVIRHCSANTLGGGVYIANGEMLLENATIEHCSALRGGGVQIEEGLFTMQQSSVSYCNATQSSGFGGCINVYGPHANAVLIEAELIGGRAFNGGGMHIGEGSANITSSLAEYCVASVGAGIHLNNGGVLKMENTTLSHGWAMSGGAIYQLNAHVFVVGGMIEFNYGEVNTGGVVSAGSRVILENVLFCMNTGNHVDDYDYQGNISLIDCAFDIQACCNGWGVARTSNMDVECGCLAMLYGQLCDKNCSLNCTGDGTCRQEDGWCNQCFLGDWGYDCNETCFNCSECFVDDGWCSLCPAKHYGEHCEQVCHPFCGGSPRTCDVRTGACDECWTNCTSCNVLTAECTSCAPGRYGTHCEHLCSTACVGSCDVATGHCDWCPSVTWGSECQNDCPPFCNGTGIGYCNPVSGECDLCPPTCMECDKVTAQCSVCVEGYYGQYCQFSCPLCDGPCSIDGVCYSCPFGMHGEFCNQSCSLGCYGEQHLCEQLDGSCEQVGVCEDGYWGLPTCSNTCSQYCVTGICAISTGACSPCSALRWGIDCMQLCPTNCLQQSCLQAGGECRLGCISGYWGSLCNQSCPTNCFDGTCNIDGSCVACVDGMWYSTHCDELCPGNCISSCSFSTGECNACIDGTYGDQCEKECNTNCLHNVCDRHNGDCLWGCVNQSYFGTNCSRKCSENCYENLCDRGSGACEDCVDGWYGVTCQNPCETTCVLGKCDSITGDCSIGCIMGHYGSKCELECPPSCPSGCGMDGACTIIPQGDCPSGFWGSMCNLLCESICSSCARDGSGCIDCSDNTMTGGACELHCPSHCVNQVCRGVEGACTLGCEEGWYGSTCTKPCHGCESRCDQESGTCDTAAFPIGSSVVGLFALTGIALGCGFMLFRRLKIPKITSAWPKGVWNDESASTISRPIQKTFANGLALITLVTEFFQCSSFLFDPVIPWNATHWLRQVARASIAALDLHMDWSIPMFWIAFGLSLFFFASVLILYVSGGKGTTSSASMMFASVMTYVLPLLGKIGLLPIARSCFAMLLCVRSPADTSIRLLVDSNVICNSSPHRALIACSVIGVMLFVPLAMRQLPAWQQLQGRELDIHWRGSHLCVSSGMKVALAAVTLAIPNPWMLIFATTATCIGLLGMGVLMYYPCSYRIVNYIRNILLEFALWTCVASIVVVTSKSNTTASIMLYIGWGVLALISSSTIRYLLANGDDSKAQRLLKLTRAHRGSELDVLRRELQEVKEERDHLRAIVGEGGEMLNIE